MNVEINSFMDYTKPVMSLLHKLQKKDVTITHVFDGEEWEKIQPGTNLKIRQDAADVILSVDESMVRVKYQEEIADLFIVLGNDSSEILSDYSFKKNSILETVLEEVSEDFYNQWEKV